jgi:hypothetical protein
VGKVVATTGMSTAGVVTKIKVVPSAKNQFEVQFEIAGPVPQEFLPAMVAKKADAMNIMLQPYPELEDDFETPKKDRKY